MQPTAWPPGSPARCRGRPALRQTGHRAAVRRGRGAPPLRAGGPSAARRWRKRRRRVRERRIRVRRLARIPGRERPRGPGPASRPRRPCRPPRPRPRRWRRQPAGAAAQVEDTFAPDGGEQLHQRLAVPPDEGVLVVVESRVPGLVRRVHAAKRAIRLRFIPEDGVAAAALAEDVLPGLAAAEEEAARFEGGEGVAARAVQIAETLAAEHGGPGGRAEQARQALPAAVEMDDAHPAHVFRRLHPDLAARTNDRVGRGVAFDRQRSQTAGHGVAPPPHADACGSRAAVGRGRRRRGPVVLIEQAIGVPADRGIEATVRPSVGG